MTTDILRHAQRLMLAFVVACLIAAGVLHANAPTHHVQPTDPYAAQETVAPAGCWFEKVSTDPELICGDPRLRPTTDTADSVR